jgi:hypothetical protein
MRNIAVVFTISKSKTLLAIAMTWALSFAPIAASAQNRPDTKDKKAADSAPAQQSAASKAAADTREAAPPKDSSGRNEGIKVHGHWVIEVFNPDGSKAARHEFENSLAASGSQTLAGVLARTSTPARFSLFLHAVPPDVSPWPGADGFIVDAAAVPAQGTGPHTFPTLTTQLTGSNSNQILIKGTATAVSQGVIDEVLTMLDFCSPSVAPSACNAPSTTNFFTGATPPQIPLAAGQIVQVTVTISFS